MYKEEITEEGIVKQSKDGIAEIVISDSDHCEECSAKIYCKPGNNNLRTLLAKDPFNSEPGDKVTITINGSTILKATFQLYGIPLLIIITTILLGVNFFIINKELYSSVLGLTFSGIYLLILSYISKKQSCKYYPTISGVRKSSADF